MIPSSQRKTKLYPWCIVRQLPNMQRMVVARFHHRSNADGYLSVLRQIEPDAAFVIVFAPSGFLLRKVDRA